MFSDYTGIWRKTVVCLASLLVTVLAWFGARSSGVATYDWSAILTSPYRLHTCSAFVIASVMTN
ncbi:hypothetical protein CCR75_001563 [Bremia lactucae]|uniref:Uncharacterized protein n=1 Tax=Bremia lactucae TaxID=4779 RepID=A0A976FPZ1_BRELC|nr:hypothetical protein CCR75_001563 [Bremia lactucae]